jgi:hypothetical protein
MKRTSKDKFWSKVKKTENCWQWTGYITIKGYGVFYDSEEKISELAHRFSFSLHKMGDSFGYNIGHHCGNCACVRPEHLYLKGEL